MTRFARGSLAFFFAVSAGAIGFLEGRALADGRLAPKSWFAGGRQRGTPETVALGAPAAPRTPASMRELFAALAEVDAPSPESTRPYSWQGMLSALAQLSLRHGFSTDLADDEGTLRRCVAISAPMEVAAFLDLWSEVAERADKTVVRDTATRLAARLDSDPFRSRVRAALLAGDRGRIRDLGVDTDPADLDAMGSALLGAALMRIGEEDDALDHWRAGALAHPESPVLHLLLAWALSGSSRPRDESTRHLAAAFALLPESEILRARLAAAAPLESR